MMAKPPRTTREKKVSFGGIQHVEKREEGNNGKGAVKTFVDEPYNRTGFTFAVRTTTLMTTSKRKSKKRTTTTDGGQTTETIPRPHHRKYRV